MKTACGMEAINAWSLSSMLSALLVFQQLSLIKCLVYRSPTLSIVKVDLRRRERREMALADLVVSQMQMGQLHQVLDLVLDDGDFVTTITELAFSELRRIGTSARRRGRWWRS